jgi:fatty-acyl-CoA synthase
MELDEVPVEVCVDVGVDGAVNLFALLEQTAQRFADRGAVYRGERRCCHGKVLNRELRSQLTLRT